MFAQQALVSGSRASPVLAGQTLGSVRPLQFEAGSLRGNPYLADGRVWRNHELAGTVLKNNIHDAVVVFELEAAGAVLGSDDGLLQGFEGIVGFARKLASSSMPQSIAEGWDAMLCPAVDCAYLWPRPAETRRAKPRNTNISLRL